MSNVTSVKLLGNLFGLTKLHAIPKAAFSSGGHLNYYRSGWVHVNQTHIDEIVDNLMHYVRKSNSDDYLFVFMMPPWLHKECSRLGLNFKDYLACSCDHDKLDGLVGMLFIDGLYCNSVGFHVDKTWVTTGYALQSVNVDTLGDK